MGRAKVWLLYSGYAVLFAAVFAVMLALLTVAAVGVPGGLLLTFFGAAVTLFDADFVITQLAPQFMLFGGLSAACASAMCGFAAVKAGILVSRLFLRVKRRCDRLRGW